MSTTRSMAARVWSDHLRRLVGLMGGRSGWESERGRRHHVLFHTGWLDISHAHTSPAKIVPERLTKLRVSSSITHPAAREILILQEPLSGHRKASVDCGCPERSPHGHQKSRCTGSPYEHRLHGWRIPGLDGPSIPSATLIARALSRHPANRSRHKQPRLETSAKNRAIATRWFSLVKSRHSVDDCRFAGNIFWRPRYIQSARTHSGCSGNTITRALILLAEDNDINQQIAVELLECGGRAPKSLSPTTAGSSADSFGRIANRRLDDRADGSSNADMDGIRPLANISRKRVSNRCRSYRQ